MQNDTKEAVIRLDERLKALRAEMLASFKSRDENLRLQANEYERRLLALNGEQARIAKIQEDFPSKDKFEGFRDKVLSELAELRGRTTGFGAARQLLFSVLALLFALLSLFLRFKS